MTMRFVFGEVQKWSCKTFGSEQERNAKGPLRHLAKEVLVELLGFNEERIHKLIHEDHVSILDSPEILKDDIQNELADALILVFDAAWRQGLSFDKLASTARKKMEINKTRVYAKPNGDEISEHREPPVTHAEVLRAIKDSDDSYKESQCRETINSENLPIKPESFIPSTESSSGKLNENEPPEPSYPQD